jgi:hypothetical protein
MESILVYVGIAGIILTIAFLVKGFETRVVLLTSGFLLGIIAGDPFAPLNGFSKRDVPANGFLRRFVAQWSSLD